MPTRVMAVYVTIYFLIPKYLKNEKYLFFGFSFVLMLISAGFLQRLFMFLFYEPFILNEINSFFDIKQIVRSIILINSTVLFVSAIKIVQFWQLEKFKNEDLRSQLRGESKIINIKSDKRFFRIPADEILFIEGLGNYVIYHTVDQKLISYTSLKDALDKLPSNFIRIHKSYVVNRYQIKSYDPESVEINKTFIPVGKSFKAGLAI